MGNVTHLIETIQANGLPVTTSQRDRRRRTAPPWWFALPAMLLFAFVVLVPSVRGVYYAFTDWDGLDPHFSFVGLGNFADMFNDADAVQAIWHTLLIAVSITVIQNAVGLLLALGVNTAIKSRNLLRDPRVTLLVQDDQVSSRGITQYLVIRGTANLEGPGIPVDYKALMDRQSQRYLGVPEFPFGEGIWDTGMIARITVDRVAGEGPWTA